MNDEDVKQNSKVECSVVICTYMSDWEKLRLTLKSILMQKNCSFEIVVTDDGSKENHFDRVCSYLESYSFSNYKLVSNYTNQGTVLNIIQGVQVCVGEFVKTISPGDYLYGKYALRQWVDFMYEHDEYIMSYCDAIYYHMENQRIVPLKKVSQPQSKEPDVRQYIVYGDFCLGASTIVRREGLMIYLEKLRGKVIYAEDFSYQLMLYCGEKIINIPKTLLMYEFGSGISTNGSSFWKKRIQEDYIELIKILLSIAPSGNNEYFDIIGYLRIRMNTGFLSNLQRVKYCPSILLFYLKKKFFPRKTPIAIDDNFVNELFSNREEMVCR